MLKADALIRFFYKVDPESLDEEAWTKRVGEMNFIFTTISKLISKLFSGN